jgi:hypothetical protein
MKKIATLALLSLLAACAADPAADTAPVRERAEAPTGSNIVRRDHRNDGSVTTYDRESVERAQTGSYGMGRPTN